VRVVRASVLGMCFGVRHALGVVRGLEDPSAVTIWGELVHNAEVLRELDERGFARVPEHARGFPPPSPAVLVTAHGISEAERERLRGAGKEVIDTTCPLVRRVHEAAKSMRDEGLLVVIVGRRGHVEVEGVRGDVPGCEVLEDESEARPFDAERIGIVCQSTTPPALAERVVRAVRERNPGKDVRFEDTICEPTRNRQEAVARLLDEVEALVVVGGANSNNTRALVALAESRGIPARRVACAAELDRAWLAPFAVVGLTAGTSTLDRCVDEVEAALRDA